MPLVSNIEFSAITLDHKHGLVVHVRADAPPSYARSALPATPKRFWKQGKSVPLGGLVALVTKEPLVPATVRSRS